MRLLDEHAPSLQQLSVSEFGTADGENGQFGIGTVLGAEHARSRELLCVRKAYRPGFEGNGQWAFPGGMVRPSTPQAGVESWSRSSLATRVAAEVGLVLHDGVQIVLEQEATIFYTPPRK
jgi:hypothetical protein